MQDRGRKSTLHGGVLCGQGQEPVQAVEECGGLLRSCGRAGAGDAQTGRNALQECQAPRGALQKKLVVVLHTAHSLQWNSPAGHV